MDHTLRDPSPRDHLHNHALHEAIFKAGLSSLAALHDENLVQTDLKPENVFISKIDSPKPIAKIGDLGLTAPDGFDKWQTQPFAMRAPDIWRGFGCSHRSDIWSLAATVFVRLKLGILGTPGIKDSLWPSLWCMTKLVGVFPDWTGLPAATALIQQELETATLLLGARDPDRPEEAYINVSPLDDELRAMGISEELSNLLSCLLVADPENRPDAAKALTSLEFRALFRRAAPVGA